MTERRQFIGYDSSAECDQFIGYDREIIIDNEHKSIRVFGGDKVGGYETARADLENVTKATLDTKLEPTIETLVPPIIDREIADEVAELNGRIDSANVDIGVNELEIENLSATKADKATSLNGYGIADAYTKSEVDVLISQSASSGLTGKASNYIEAIPDNIKLELANNALTLKNGSKLYDGAGNPINITSDINRSNFSAFPSGVYLVFYSKSYGSLLAGKVTECTSGATDSSSTKNHIWYDTTNKQIKFADNSGTAYSFTDLSLPLCRCQITYGTGVLSIDQIFNFWGKIGDAIFLNQGITFDYGDGWNTDGSLKSVKQTTAKLVVRELTQSEKNLGIVYIVCYNAESFGFGIGYKVVKNSSERKPLSAGGVAYYYVKDENLTYVFDNDNPQKFVYLGYIDVPNDKLYIRNTIKLADEQDVALLNGNNTFAGTNNFLANVYVRQSGADTVIAQQNLNDISGSVPSINQLRSYRVIDKNSKILSDFRHVHNIGNGRVDTVMLARNTKSDGQEVSGIVMVSVAPDGSISTSAPTPPINSNANQISTTAWFNTKIQVVSTLPASPDPNVYYFIPE